MAEPGGVTGEEQKEKDNAESMIEAVQKKIHEAFEIFDHEANETVDVREVGTIIRSLGCVPTEEELHDMLTEIAEEDDSGYVKYKRFEALMTRVLMERRYRAATEEQLIKAFQVLDKEGKGIISQDDLVQFMTNPNEGDRPFTQEEMEEMLSTAIDPEKKGVVYRDFVNLLLVEES